MPDSPGRALLRVAGALTQLTCGSCLLIGTIGLVLVLQHPIMSLASVAVWLAMAMAGLVFGGLSYRGGLVSVTAAAAIDAGFGVAMVLLDDATLRALLEIVPPSDVTAIGQFLHIAGYAMIGAGALCVVAVPQGIQYARWFRGAASARNAMSTARGFPPPAVPARGSAYIIPAETQPGSRRRLYLVLGGVSIGVGTGLGVLVSSPPSTELITAVADRAAPGAQGPVVVLPSTTEAHAGVATVDPGGTHATELPGSAAIARAPEPVQQLVADERAAIANADAPALAALLLPTVFGLGVDGDEVAEGRDAVAAQLVHDLGTPPERGFRVEQLALAIGRERNHAWIAEQLEIAAAGQPTRRLAITQLAAVIEGSWRIVAVHWATPVDDATAERLAILGTLPAPRPIADRDDAPDELARAVRAAFASRAAFAAARSEHPDAFNLGSGGERVHGGAAIKRVFTKLKAQLRQRDGARVVAGSAWDPAQRADPWIGFAALNVDFTSRTHAATELTQTFRVLAIVVKEDAEWKLVQTQWSNAGPIRP